MAGSRPARYHRVCLGRALQYHGSDPNNVAGYTTERINLDALAYDGHSGGPLWRFDGADHFLQGLISTSDRAGDVGATRLTSNLLTQRTGVINEDEGARPPVARPDLIEYMLELERRDLLRNVAAPGQNFSVKYNAFNAGHAGTGPTIVDFYLSTNSVISTFNTWSAAWPCPPSAPSPSTTRSPC